MCSKAFADSLLISAALCLLVSPTAAGAAEQTQHLPPPDPPQLLRVVPQDPLPLLQQYIRINTSNPPGNESAAAEFFKQLLEAHGIEATIIPVGDPAAGRANVVARLKATAGAAATAGPGTALLLFNHMDVVQADASRWSADPFGAVIRDGYLYGRGTLDMKTTGLLQALCLIRLKDEGVALTRDLIFLGTADEEAGNTGMEWMVEHHVDLLKEAALALTEGDNIVVTQTSSGPVTQSWGVDVAEKITAWMKLTAYGTAGHGSVPVEGENPVVRLVRALDRISRYQTPIRLLPSVESYYRVMADRVPGFAPDKLRALAASLRDDAAFRAKFLSDPGRAASVRNTISITVLQGGPQTNVIPSTATANLDCRLLPGEDPVAFAGEIRRIVNDPNITIEPLLEARPATSSSTSSALYRAIESAARRFDRGVPVTPTILSSYTESGLLRPLGIHSYGFEPYALDDREVSLSHSDDERISIDNVLRGFEIMYAIVKETATSPVER